MNSINSLLIIQAWQLLVERKEPREALRILEQELDNNSENKVLLYSIGFAYRMLNDFEQAEKFYLKALESKDESIISFPNLKGYSDLMPLPDVMYCHLGIVYQLKGEYKKSVDALEKAIQINRHYINAYNSLGITYRKMGNYIKALEIYDKGREMLLELANNEALKDKEKCYIDKFTANGKKIREMQPYWLEKVHELLKSNIDYSMLCTNEARIFTELRKLNEAEELLKEAVEFIPDNFTYNDPFEALEYVKQLKTK